MIFYANTNIKKNISNIKAKQISHNIQLNKKSYINIEPNLEINSNNVICSHGATIGKINKKEMKYIISKGIKKNKAKKILTKIFLKNILNNNNDKYFKFLDNYLKCYI